MHKFLAKIWKKPSENLGDIYSHRIAEWREQPTVNRLDGPTRPDRARALGYKAKQGFVVARIRVPKGRRKRPMFKAGRRPKHRGRFFSLDKSKKAVAEEKASRKFRNMEVLLGRRGWKLRMVRMHPCRPLAPCRHQRQGEEVDSPAAAQGPRFPRTHKGPLIYGCRRAGSLPG